MSVAKFRLLTQQSVAKNRIRNAEYHRRLRWQASQLLQRKGDRPLRNQQRRLIERARRFGLLTGGRAA